MEPINVSNRKQGHHIPQQTTHGFASHSPITPPAFYHSHQSGSNAALSGKDFEIFLGVADEQGPRTHMQDRHTLIKNFQVSKGDNIHRSFLAVYDGHASSRASEYASRRLHEILAAQPAVIQCRGSNDQGEDAVMEKALKEAFGIVDEEIIDDANHKGKRYGTTAVCALIVNKVMYVAHCGDSRAILFRDGAAVQLTQDHKPASNPSERARIEAQGGEVNVQTDYVISADHKSALNMSRALGDQVYKQPHRVVESEPDVSKIQLAPARDHFLVLGSDGLFESLSTQQIGSIAKHALDATKEKDDSLADVVADALVSEALRRGGHDNVTAAVAILKWF